MKIDYHIPGSPNTRNAIHSFWQIQRFQSSGVEQIIPKGVVEIIFNFGDGKPVNAQLGDKPFQISRSIINGFNRKPINIQIPDQHLFFGVRFQPLAIKKIFKTPASEFADQAIDSTLVDPALYSLWHQLADQNSFQERVGVITEWISHRMSQWQPREQMINDFLCADNQHELSIKELANTLCYSPRQITRKVFEATGLNTEEILLYKKYLHAVNLVHHTDLSLTAIAHQSNFSDQSHFIRSFKTFTNMTPGEYKLRKGRVAGHIFEDVR